MASNNQVIIDRDYSDNFSIKEFAKDTLVAKYFPDIDVSLRSVGTVGFTSELISNISEDAFNTGSVLFRETFPNRAQIPESIYSHAAIFQLTNVFSKAALCNFLLVMEEESIVKNMQDSYDKDTGIYHFYIDKNTIIYVEDIPFTLDYDIEMRIVKRTSDIGDEYIYSASYITREYNNSISVITDPYIKIRRSDDGFIALEVACHQCTRVTSYEMILTNGTINYPIIDVPFEGKLAGFDILYKKPSETVYTTQMKTLPVYSQPINTPFCYYQLIDENTLRITFNSRDDYFTPEYDSEIQVILYITNGESGNFDVYNGTNISIVATDEKYPYATSYLTAAKPMTSSSGGSDQLSLSALQSLTVEGYRTANALTTENDLSEYFSNYKYRYGNSDVMFIKKRDDIFERIFSGFLVMRNGDYIFKTNTLNLFLNLGEMKNPEESIYMLDPGILFTANENDGYAKFLRDKEKEERYYQEYLEAVRKGEIPYIEDTMDKTDLPKYLDRDASFAEFKRRKGYDDKLSVFDMKSNQLKALDDPSSNKFLLINPFLIRFKKSPNLISLYLTHINQKSLVDFVNQNMDSYVQFIIYQLELKRKFAKEKKYEFRINLLPSINISDDYPIIDTYEEIVDGQTIIHYKLNEKYNTVNNDLRVFLLIEDDERKICYIEMYPTEYNTQTEVFTFYCDAFTDDHITSDGRLRLLQDVIYRSRTGDYYKRHNEDYTLYSHHNADGTLIQDNIPVDNVTALINSGAIKRYSNIHNLTSSDDVLIPFTDVKCTVYTTYRRVYHEETGKLELATEDQTNNILEEYDPTMKTYIWTNEYSTSSDPLTFLKPLNNVRSNLLFRDYTLTTEVKEGVFKFVNDIMDVDILSLPFVRWSIIRDENNLAYFMNSFIAQYNQLTEIINTTLRGQTSIDVKFYNTYGRSNNFIVGENDQKLDTVNLSLSFDMWFVPGTDQVSVIPEIKNFIKNDIETINTSGMNNLHISNLMRKIESKFSYVDHIRFNEINNYESSYQSVKNNATDLSTLSVAERRYYVPELLVVDIDDITINGYEVS